MWSGFVDFISSATPTDGTFSSEPDGRLECKQLSVLYCRTGLTLNESIFFLNMKNGFTDNLLVIKTEETYVLFQAPATM